MEKLMKHLYVLRACFWTAAGQLLMLASACFHDKQATFRVQVRSLLLGDFMLVHFLCMWSVEPSKGDISDREWEKDGDFSKWWTSFRNLTPNKHGLRVTPSGQPQAQPTGMIPRTSTPGCCSCPGCLWGPPDCCFREVCNPESALWGCNEPVPLSSPPCTRPRLLAHFPFPYHMCSFCSIGSHRWQV